MSEAEGTFVAACKTVDEYLDRAVRWQKELAKLREVLLSTGLEETVKWGAPCYTSDGKNIVGIGGFKSYVGLWFFQGALLQDEAGVLINAQEDKTKAMRQWRFESMKDIKVRQIKSYVKEAIEHQRAGREIKADRRKPVVVPKELKAALSKNKEARDAFAAMSVSCQRAYAEHIAEAKRDETKERRLEKIMPMIAAGGGLHDKYRNC